MSVASRRHSVRLGPAPASLGLLLGAVALFLLPACPGSQNILATLEIHNNSGLAVVDFRLSASNKNDWGPNQLSSPLPAGGTRSITGAPLGDYDARATLEDGSKEYLTKFMLEGGKTKAIAVVPPQTGRLTIANDTPFGITALYLKEASQSDWGTNLLTSPIAPNTRSTLTGVPAGTFDDKIVFADGSSFSRSGVTIAVGQTATLTLLATGQVTVVNSSGVSIVEFHLKPPGQTDFGPNLLQAPIAAHSQATMTGVPAGTWDDKVVFADGRSETSSGVIVQPGQSTSVTVAAPCCSVKLTNAAATPITELYLSRSSDPTWGPKQNSSPISGSFTLNDVPPGSYDLLAIYPDSNNLGRGRILLNISVSDALTVFVDLPTRVTVRVVNNAAYPLNAFLAKPAESPTFGPNLLDNPIDPGRYHYIYEALPAGSWDVQFRDSIGGTYTGTAPISMDPSSVATLTVSNAAPPDGGH